MNKIYGLNKYFKWEKTNIAFVSAGDGLINNVKLVEGVKENDQPNNFIPSGRRNIFFTLFIF
jgi:hypothetical protein